MLNGKRSFNIAVIGIGPRGAKICEQILICARSLPTYHFQLFLFEPNKLGEGCHKSNQSKSLLMNTPASQLSLFSSDHDSINLTNKFDTWLTFKSGAKSQSTSKDPLKSDFYPRYLFGEYLCDSFSSLLNNCPNNLRWTHIPETVIDIENINGHQWKLSTIRHKYKDIDYVHITTGHGVPDSNHQSKNTNTFRSFIECTYPISSHTKDIPATHKIALEGLGLTSFDIIAELTEQRGGRFLTQKNGLLKYIPSGHEPSIFAFSRSGLPLRAKPKNHNVPRDNVNPYFLTSQKIRSLTCKSPLDFEKDVLPLLQLDMKYVYYKTLLKDKFLKTKYTSSDDMKNYISNLDNNVEVEKQFNFDNMCQPLFKAEKGTHYHYSMSLINHLKNDFFEAELGVNKSPIKAAENLLRDLREDFSQLIDFKKLSGESHNWVYQSFLPKMKQLSVGPPRVRIAQWLALIDAKILKIDLGPGATCTPSGNQWKLSASNWPEQQELVDILIRARIPDFQFTPDSLVGKMINKGYASPFNNNGFKSGGIEVSHSFNIINHKGVAINTLWATGILTEGARFYTFSLPSADQPSRFTRDAEAAVKSMFSHITESTKLTKETV